MPQAVIIDAVRTPIGKRAGALAEVHPVDLGAQVLAGLVARTGVDPAVVDDVVWGCVTTIGEQSSNVGRWSALAAGWPETVPGTTVDRACGSSQQAIAFAAAGVVAGHYDLVVAGGVESMSRVPMGSTRNSGHGMARGPLLAHRYPGIEFSQGLAAEMIASQWGFSRSDVDAFALESHARAAAARDQGRFESQIVPTNTPQGMVDVDEGIREGGTLESLAGLRAVFDEDGVVTAANASQISDGASAVMITTPERAVALGVKPVARVHSSAVVGVDPVLMLTGPIPATEKVLAKAGLTLADIGTFEVNEAFASVALAWLAETDVDPALLNPDGGAIALGHPLGCSGARLTTTLLHRMRERGERFGLQTICEAGGMANAMVLELLP
ncbi:thiolase family protein [Nocardioides sp. AE5]|uniref:thiolase family protein n=1 Tax=Nocardioides sp. AE5 TaxID=2962573 RepID=UPI002881D68F|nr:thiolase family protein [Nocardioides sp. AE5]MDT0203052.1 thiolase family protein [Nocardioides sp. AE5]